MNDDLTRKALDEGLPNDALTEHRARLAAASQFLALLQASLDAAAVSAGEEVAAARRQQACDNLVLALAQLRRRMDETEVEYVRRLATARPAAPDAQPPNVTSVGDPLQPLRDRWAEWARIVVATLEGLTRRGADGMPALALKVQRLDADWQWAGAQILVHRAQFAAAADPKPAEEAARALAELDSHGVLQARVLGLGPMTAHAHLIQAISAEHDNRDLMIKALRHAKRAVDDAPFGDLEHRVLGNIYKTLTDFSRADEEWRRSLALDPNNLDTVNEVARGYWNLGVFSCSGAGRQSAFTHVIELLEQALSLVESQPLGRGNAEEVIKVNGWIHHWLGRFNGELMKFDVCAQHLRIALNLGYKPIESRVALGENYYEAKAYEKAEHELRAAVQEARRWSRGLGTLKSAQAPGEDMPINDLLAIVYITWASLTVHLGVDLPRAERLLHGAKRRLNRRRRCERPSMTDAPFSDERDMRCRFHEARALLLLAHRDVSGCIRECEISLAGAPRSGAWLLLARALLLGVHDSVLDDAPALDRTRAALNRAREADLRGVFTQDLVEIESHLAAARATSTRP